MLLKSKNIHRFLATALFAALAPLAPADAVEMPFSSLKAGRQDREYLLYRTNRSAPAPLVIVLHGGYGAINGARKLGFEELADENGFSVVYPRGTKKQWMDGRHNNFAIENRAVDDIAFLKALINELVKTKVADPERIYMVGFSTGGIMAYRAACEMSGQLAAVAAVSASMPQGYEYRCRPSRPMPLLIMNATSDPVIPWQGGAVNTSGNNKDSGEVISVDKNVAFWRRENKCSDTRHVEKIATDKSRLPVFHYRWDGCSVELYEVKGGDHRWPGRISPLISPHMFLMGSATQMDATSVIWGFLKHRTRSTR